MSKPSEKASGRKKKNGQGVRWDKIARVREEIARGAYDTPDNWEKIIARLLLAVQSDPSPAGRKPRPRSDD